MGTELNRIEAERVGAAPFEEQAVMMVSDGYLIDVGQNDHDRGSSGPLPEFPPKIVCSPTLASIP